MSLSDFGSDIGLSKLPKARTTEIVIQDVANELLIYNLKTNEAHHLNKTVSMVWQNCDGKTTFAQMAAMLSKELGEQVEEDFVWLALRELEKIKLLDEIKTADPFAGISRRKVLFRYALPALALPIVVSLVTPASAQVQGSCLGQGQIDCFNNLTPCCPGLSCVAALGGALGPGVCVAPI